MNEIVPTSGDQMIVIPSNDAQYEWAGTCWVVMLRGGVQPVRVPARVESWFDPHKNNFHFVVHAPDVNLAERWDGIDEATIAELNRLRNRVAAAEAAAKDWEAKAHAVDRLYVGASAVEAEVRVALDAPNPCDIVAWAREVKKQAGPMDGDIHAQVRRIRGEA